MPPLPFPLSSPPPIGRLGVDSVDPDAGFNDEEDGGGEADGQEDSLVMTEEAGRDQAGDSLLHFGIHLGQPPPPQADPTSMAVPYYTSTT